ncbi:hypothetical protein AB0L44_09195 [Nonomuraea wenchangensis]|uniref:P-loop ATPase, Sll1717 family n=1 Tax=Nonomuraea wenchangensis TaxID=568860 RepID=UPI00342EBA79
MPKPASRRLKGNFSLGGEAAEHDWLLQTAFYSSARYEQLVSRTDPKCFLVGRTGSGKSAALQRLEDENPGHTIRIKPDDLSLPYITNVGVIKQLTDLDIHLDPFFLALWKHVFIVEIIRKRYNIDSEAARDNILRSLYDRIRRNRSKRAALDYLKEFEGKFWCETDQRVRDITHKLEEQVKGEGSLEFGKPIGKAVIGKGGTRTSATEEHIELVQRYQRIVNETQVPRLNKMIDVIEDDILDTDQNYMYIVIDDLDQDWVDETAANNLIRCLFRAIHDLKRVRNLKILVALRTNIFEHLDFGSKTGGQEEKFRALTLHMQWTKAELQELLDERVRVAAEEYGVPRVSSIKDLLPSPNQTRGNALDYILGRTLMRPRDAIVFLNECIQRAAGKSKLTWEAIQSAEAPYSRNRLLALRDEWKPTYPAIERVYRVFTRCPLRMRPATFTRYLDEIILLAEEPDFAGVSWMEQLSQDFWKSASQDNWYETYAPLARLLFDIGFIGCTTTGFKRGKIYSYDDPEFFASTLNISRVQSFFVHPCFHAALDIDPGKNM